MTYSGTAPRSHGWRRRGRDSQGRLPEFSVGLQLVLDGPRGELGDAGTMPLLRPDCLPGKRNASQLLRKLILLFTQVILILNPKPELG